MSKVLEGVCSTCQCSGIPVRQFFTKGQEYRLAAHTPTFSNMYCEGSNTVPETVYLAEEKR